MASTPIEGRRPDPMTQEEALPKPNRSSPWISAGLPALLITVTGAITAWVVFIAHPMERALYSDMANYAAIARDIMAGRFDLTHFFQPIGFPLWMALWRTLAGGDWWLLKLSHVALVVLTVFLGWRAARHIMPKPWDLLVLVLLSFQVQWWALAGFAMPETLYTFLVTALLWSATRWIRYRRVRDAALTGLFFGIGFYVKGSAALLPVVVLVWLGLGFALRKPVPFASIRHLAAAGAMALTVALAHGAFALATYGTFKLGADSGALNFVEGKCRHKENRDSRGHVWLSPLFVYLGETDVRRWDEPFSNQPFFWKEGLKCIKANPAVMLTSTRYVYYLFGGNPLWPVQAWRAKTTEVLYEKAFLFLVAPLTLIGLMVAIGSWDKPQAAAALLVLSLFLMVYVFKSELRYRVPFDAATMILATLGTRQVTLAARSLWKGSR
jgi:hypothetical protein